MENIKSHCRFAGISLTTREDGQNSLCSPGCGAATDVLYPQAEKPDAARNDRLAETLAGFMEAASP